MTLKLRRRETARQKTQKDRRNNQFSIWCQRRSLMHWSVQGSGLSAYDVWAFTLKLMEFDGSWFLPCLAMFCLWERSRFCVWFPCSGAGRLMDRHLVKFDVLQRFHRQPWVWKSYLANHSANPKSSKSTTHLVMAQTLMKFGCHV